MGPTAAGKTALAIALHQQFPVDIISVDSALIYRGMNIGTAKPSPQQLHAHPHQLVDICDPVESYSAANFCKDALQAMHCSWQLGRIPLLVGGTMLYFKALLEGLSPLPHSNKTIRTEIESEAQKYGWQWLHNQLATVDPVAAQRIHAKDTQRLSRALEIYRISGKTLTELTATPCQPLPYKVAQFAFMPPKALLDKLIATRFQMMLAHNFEQEVCALKERSDLHPDLPSIRCVGYRQMWQYLDGKLTYDAMCYRAIVATRQLAKRQLTWLRNWPKVQILEQQNAASILGLNIQRLLSQNTTS